MKLTTEYWTVFGFNTHCSTHKTALAAERAACECEKGGGYPHRIFKVQEIDRKPKGKKR